MKEKIKKIFFKESIWFFIIFILISFLFFIWLDITFEPEGIDLAKISWDDTSIEIAWENIRIINWEAISAIALISTAFFIAMQALATKNQSSATRELTDKTMLPRVNVGLKLRKLEEKSITKVSIHNLSGLPIWIWLDIDLFRDEDFKEEKKLLKTLSYVGFPIAPNQAYEFPRGEIDPIIKEHGMVYARIKYRCNINSYPPEPDIKPTELIYRYEADREVWLISGVGMEFTPLYEELRKT